MVWFVFLVVVIFSLLTLVLFYFFSFFSPFFPSSSSSSLSSRGDLNKLGAEALTFVIITVNSLYLVGGVFLLFKALAIEAGVGDKFASNIDETRLAAK